MRARGTLLVTLMGSCQVVPRSYPAPCTPKVLGSAIIACVRKDCVVLDVSHKKVLTTVAYAVQSFPLTGVWVAVGRAVMALGEVTTAPGPSWPPGFHPQ